MTYGCPYVPLTRDGAKSVEEAKWFFVGVPGRYSGKKWEDYSMAQQVQGIAMSALVAFGLGSFLTASPWVFGAKEPIQDELVKILGTEKANQLSEADEPVALKLFEQWMEKPKKFGLQEEQRGVLTKTMAYRLQSVRGKQRFILHVGMGISESGFSKDCAAGIALLLKDNDPSIREDAAETLVLLKATEYTQDIAGLLADNEAFVRGAAAELLAQLKATEYAKDIAALLNDRDSQVRTDAADALGKLKAKEYAQDIAELSKRERSNFIVANALGELGSKEQVEDLAKTRLRRS
ncbi:MAG: HEAT repeat domain-containing protein [Candidatus Omnitrophica bacterium]|nr:HEAT repeat domain-containing protein [Candidatus Omnitrophota bacterium]